MNPLTGTAVGKRYRARWAVRECGFTVPEGSVVALVGPNGACSTRPCTGESTRTCHSWRRTGRSTGT